MPSPLPSPLPAPTVVDATRADAPHGLLRVVQERLRDAAAPVTIVCAGSSTTAGVAASAPARGWVAVMAGRLGDAARVINVGIPGANAGGYLPDASVAAIAAERPDLVIHMIGANDIRELIPPARYIATLAGRLDALDAAAGAPLRHLLVHSYQRADSFEPVAPWSAYADAVRAHAAGRPAVFADLSGAYAALGVPGGDPHALLDGDLIHQADAGHAVMAELVHGIVAGPSAPR